MRIGNYVLFERVKIKENKDPLDIRVRKLRSEFHKLYAAKKVDAEELAEYLDMFKDLESECGSTATEFANAQHAIDMLKVTIESVEEYACSLRAITQINENTYRLDLDVEEKRRRYREHYND